MGCSQSKHLGTAAITYPLTPVTVEDIQRMKTTQSANANDNTRTTVVITEEVKRVERMSIKRDTEKGIKNTPPPLATTAIENNPLATTATKNTQTAVVAAVELHKALTASAVEHTQPPAASAVETPKTPAASAVEQQKTPATSAVEHNNTVASTAINNNAPATTVVEITPTDAVEHTTAVDSTATCMTTFDAALEGGLAYLTEDDEEDKTVDAQEDNEEKKTLEEPESDEQPEQRKEQNKNIKVLEKIQEKNATVTTHELALNPLMEEVLSATSDYESIMCSERKETESILSLYEASTRDLEGQVADERELNEELTAKNNLLESKHRALEARIRELESTNQQLEAQIVDMIAWNAGIEHKNEQLESDNKKLQEQLEKDKLKHQRNFESYKSELANNTANYKARLVSYSNTNEELRKRSAAKDLELAALKTANNSLKVDLDLAMTQMTIAEQKKVLQSRAKSRATGRTLEGFHPKFPVDPFGENVIAHMRPSMNHF